MLSNLEKEMWKTSPKSKHERLSTSEINEKYEKGEHRIVTETNREKLPNFFDALKRNEYMEVRPFYQRRSRWDEERQSKLIELFIINIPVPPIFRNFSKSAVSPRAIAWALGMAVYVLQT
jgi:hypothetical protein